MGLQADWGPPPQGGFGALEKPEGKRGQNMGRGRFDIVCLQ